MNAGFGDVVSGARGIHLTGVAGVVSHFGARDRVSMARMRHFAVEPGVPGGADGLALRSRGYAYHAQWQWDRGERRRGVRCNSS